MRPGATTNAATQLSVGYRLALGLACAWIVAGVALGASYTIRTLDRPPSVDLDPLRRGQAYFEAGELGEAVREFEIAAAILPTDPAPLLALATTLGELGASGAQLAAVREATLRAPDDPRALLALGTALARAGETQEALVALRRSSVLAPRSVDAHVNLGIVELQQRRPRKALEHLERALALDPDNAVAATAAGQARVRIERDARGGRP